MKKLLNSVFAILLIALSYTLISCGSTTTPVDEPVISTVEANHIRVDLTKSTVKITLSKTAEENIKKIDVLEVPFASVCSVNMTKNKVSFIWPFAEKDKEYTLCAKFEVNGKTQEEYVSFKTHGDVVSQVTTPKDDNNNALSLVAKSNQRFLKCEAPFDSISSLLKNVKAENAKLLISLYSGKHYQTTQKDAVLVGTSKTDFNKNSLSAYTSGEGLDIIKSSQRFGMNAKQLNAALSKNLTYFAQATVQFTLPEYQDSILFTAKGIFSNDTIYTPVSESELANNEAAANAK